MASPTNSPGTDSPKGSLRMEVITVTESHDPEHRDSRTRVRGTYTQIWTAGAIINLPMLAVSGLLLGLIFRHHIIPHDGLKDLQLIPHLTTSKATSISMKAKIESQV